MMNQKLIPKIHIIGLTAFTNASDIKNCLKHGMSDVLAKPLNLKEFKQILALIWLFYFHLNLYLRVYDYIFCNLLFIKNWYSIEFQITI